jgi:hypothetical protein
MTLVSLHRNSVCKITNKVGKPPLLLERTPSASVRLPEDFSVNQPSNRMEPVFSANNQLSLLRPVSVHLEVPVCSASNNQLPGQLRLGNRHSNRLDLGLLRLEQDCSVVTRRAQDYSARLLRLNRLGVCSVNSPSNRARPGCSANNLLPVPPEDCLDQTLPVLRPAEACSDKTTPHNRPRALGSPSVPLTTTRRRPSRRLVLDSELRVSGSFLNRWRLHVTHP